jgi:hypothetical protein
VFGSRRFCEATYGPATRRELVRLKPNTTLPAEVRLKPDTTASGGPAEAAHQTIRRTAGSQSD